MNRTFYTETVPSRSHYAETLAAGRRIEHQKRRSMTLFVCLLPIAILVGWGAVRTIEKLFCP